MNVKQIIYTWFVGNKRDSVTPLKLLEPLYAQHIGILSNKNAGRIKIRQMKCVMKLIEEYAKIE